MPDPWMPGARVIQRSPSSYTLLGGPRVAVWHSTETPAGSALAVAQGVNMARWPAHLIWDGSTGEIYQILAADKAGGALVTGNREGTMVIQVEAVGFAKDAPLSAGPTLGLDAILAWMDSWGIPRSWPAGPPLAYPASFGTGNGTRGKWGSSGHYAHSQVPANDHGDPGLVDLAKWRAPAAPTGPAWDEPPTAYLLWKGAKDPVQGRYSFVRWVQTRLVAHGYSLIVDGDFGPATDTVVRAFQAAHGLTIDGVVGSVTHIALR
jgi:peptidoglycan hydrolase-like protein with peptidoglycan-binding domain